MLNNFGILSFATLPKSISYWLENPTNLHSEQEKYTTAPSRTINSMRQQLPATQTTYFYHFQTNYFALWITKYETKLGFNKKAPKRDNC